jgi:hypothetical protein
MFYRALADAAVGLHFAFILFVLLGGLLVLRRPRIAWLHIPAFLWGALIEFGGWICPLTYLENHFRLKSAAEGYETSFIEHYIVPLIYPDLLFPGGFPQSGFIATGVFVLVLNGVIYWRVWVRRRDFTSAK